MPAANIKINGVAASNNDLPINVLVQLDNQNTGGELTYLWTILDQPPGPADVLSSTVIQNPTFTPRKEGTYLIELVVNATLPSEVRDRKIVGIRQVKTRERVPAADETTEDGSRGWAGAAGSFLQLVDAARADPVIVVGQTGAGGLTVGNIVRCTGVAVIKSGLPGQESIPSFTLAAATAVANVDEALGIVIGAVSGAGGPYAINTLVRVRIFGLFLGATGGGAVVGNPVYLSDLGTLALAPGTVTRQVGTVAAAGGGTFDCWFNGGTGIEITLATTAPANVTKAAAVVGVSLTAARSDHKHDITTAAPAAASTTSSLAAEGVATSLARSDHTHAINVSQQNVGTSVAANVAAAFPVFLQLDAATPFELALAAGTYLVAFSCRFTNNTNNAFSLFALQTGATFGASVAVANSVRQSRASAAGAQQSVDIVMIVVAGGATNLYVSVSSDLGSTVTVNDRTLTALRLV